LPIRTSILLRPIRVDRPAARTTPATRSPVMDTALSRAQMASGPPCVHGQELGDDADRHLLGTVRADVETDGCKQLLVVPGERAKYFLLARAWPEQAEIGERLSRERPQPVAIVHQRVRLHHGEVLAGNGQRQPVDAVGRTPQR